MIRTLAILVDLALAAYGLAAQAPEPASGPSLPVATRDEMIDIARRLAEHSWVCRKENTRASCVPDYRSDFRASERVTGIAYDWGGMDGPEPFDRKLAQDQAAGSHSRHGVTECTAGIDCSGFVSLCWKQARKYGTANIDAIAVRPKLNWYADLKPGDALNKPGSHIVLFAGYRPDGNPIVYEASGSNGKVILNRTSTWSRFIQYHPLQYKMVRED